MTLSRMLNRLSSATMLREIRAVRPAAKLSTKIYPNKTTSLDSTQLSGPFNKVLIANRGEIACRVIRTARKMGIKSVAVYSDADTNAEHVRQADEAVYIGPSTSSESYLVADKIIDACLMTGAGAVHPGYGFLSENIDFCQRCAKSGIIFIGPSPFAIKAMGNKSESKHLMEVAGVPLSPGYHGSDMTDEKLQQEAVRIGYPVMIKAVAGGGGKGMRTVLRNEDFLTSLHSCRRESLKSFGDDSVLIEKFITDPRHVEFQVFGDTHGNVVHLMERDCSIQRRHQKVLEESPAFMLPAEVHQAMANAAVACARAVNYVGAGTVEFLVDSNTHEFYFCEMNTRLQVEHPVTELVTGQDLVEWQLRVARGEMLPLSQEEITAKCGGCAVEARIYAENPLNNFLPASGPLLHLRLPNLSTERNKVVRVDSGVAAGDTVSTFYDPMIAKLIVHAETRPQAMKLLESALREYQVAGIPNNIDFLVKVVRHKHYSEKVATTGFFDEHLTGILDSLSNPTSDALHKSIKFGIASFAKALQTRGSVIDIWSAESAEFSNWRNGRQVRKEFQLQFKGEEKTTVISVDHIGSNTMGLLTMDSDGQQLPQGSCVIKSSRLYAESDQHCVWENTLLVDNIEVSGTICLQYPTATKSAIVDVWLNSADGADPSHSQFSLSQKSVAAEAEDKGNPIAFAPMPGRVIKIVAENSQSVEKGQPILLIEAMKMEHVVVAPSSGIIKIFCATGENVQDGEKLAEISSST